MEIKKIKYPEKSQSYKNKIFQLKQDEYAVDFGTVFLKKNSRIPKKGFSRHPQDEISIIQQGKIEMVGENGKTGKTLSTGEVAYIKAHEPQAGNVLEDTKIIYILISKSAPQLQE